MKKKKDVNVILLLFGIREEISPFLRMLHCSFDTKIRLYQCQKKSTLIYAMTTGPGLRRKKEIRKAILESNPDLILNAGAVGSLKKGANLRWGTIQPIQSILSTKDGKQFQSSENGFVLLSISEIMNSQSDRADLADQYGATLVDMEAHPICSLVEHLPMEGEKPPLHFVKIIGDRPEDSDLYRDEAMIRDWHHKSIMQKWDVFKQFPGGPIKLFTLLVRKKIVYYRLSNSVKKILQSVEKEGLENLTHLFETGQT